MAVLNACFLFSLFLIGFSAILLVMIPILHLLRVQRKRRWIGGAFALYVVAVVACFFWNTRPAAIFEMHFGFPPPSDVRNLKSKHYILGDSGNTTLSFKAGRETVGRIVQHCFPDTLDQSPDLSGWRNFHREFSEYFGFESYDLWYNEETGRVHFVWTGID